MPRRYYLLLVLATLTGAWLRVWRLTEVPPGLHYDLAATALLGNEVAFNGYRPLFIQAYTGHEPLFYYWLGLWFNLIGSSVFSLRLAAALVGVLTIPAAFFAVRELMRWLQPGDRAGQYAVAALAAVLLAEAFFHLTFSRFGFRVITQPLLQSLALGWLFRALNTGGARPRLALGRFALAGALTGLTAYTYLAARLFPIPLAGFWLVVLAGAWRARLPERGRWTAGFGVYTGAALLAFAPLGVYFLQHPADFFNRVSQVAGRPGETALLWEGVRRAAEMLFINGEPYDRYNLPGLPLFPMPLGIVFVVGILGVLGVLIARPGGRPRWTAILLLLWLPAMLAPTALAVNEVFPSVIRAFGLTPLVLVFPALGLSLAFRWLQRQAPGPLFGSPYPFSVLTAGVLVFGAVSVYQLYFVEWAGLRSQRLANDADLAGIAAYLNRQDLTEVTPYVTSLHYRHPTLAYLARDFARVHWLTGGAALALPPEGAALIAVAASAPLPEAWTAGWGAFKVHEQLGVDGRPEFTVYRFEAGAAPPLPAFAPASANFGNLLTLSGYRLAVEGAQLWVEARWRVENAAPLEDYLPYARLYDATDRAWAQSGNFTFPSQQWTPGATLITRHRIDLPPGLPAAAYAVKIGVYSEAAASGLPRLTAAGAFGGERAVLGPTAPLSNTLAAPAVMLAAFAAAPVAAPPAGGAQLLAAQAPAGALRPHERFELGLFWQAPAAVDLPVTVWLGGRPLAEVTLALGPTTATRLALRVPADQPAGRASLRVGVAGAAPVTVAEVETVALARAYALPAAARPVEAAFGGVIALAGYDVIPGAEAGLTLYWRALAEQLEADYTVFVHVRDGAGQIVAQADAQPQAGGYPTSLWLPGEVVADHYQFALAPGNYSVWVGLYLAETGGRLSVAGAPADDQLLLTTIDVP